MLYIVLCANLCVAQDTTHILYRYSYCCNRDAQSWNLDHSLYKIFVSPKSKLAQKKHRGHWLPHFLQPHHLYINHIQSLYIHIHIYITYTYNNNVLCAYITSYVCCANLLEVYKTPLSFSSSLSLLMLLIYESLLEFYTTCLRVACLPLARLKTCRKIYNLLEIYTMTRIVTKYIILFDIMTLTFCNNHCQHLFICEIYNVT